jgi:hypothetical protein
LWHDGPVPRFVRPGPIGLLLTAYDAWRRLPAKQRRQIVDQVRQHGPRVVEQAVSSVRAARGSLRSRR